MSCQRRDEDLLLHSHGELGGLRKALLEAHLRRCPRCQEQRERHAAASTLMAAAIRGEALGPWRSRAAVGPPQPLPGALRWALAAVLALLVAGATAAALVWLPESTATAPQPRRQKTQPPSHQSASITDASCAKCHGQLPANHPR